MRLRRPATTLLIGVVLLIGQPLTAQIELPERPVRLFAQFVGTWTLDEGASTGQLMMAPRVPVTLTIATTPTELTVTRKLRLHPQDRISDSPPPEVYRLDGTETWIKDARSGVTLDRSLRFTLVADMLALTIRDAPRAGGRAFTQVTDALAVDGDVLTLHRQLTSMTDAGAIYVMQQPTNNFKHTFVYRRAKG
jgi:hypothetical protein